MSLWRGIAVPKGTPDEVIGRLERAFLHVAESPDFRDFATKMGAGVEVRRARDFDRLMASDDREISSLMEQIGLRKQYRVARSAQRGRPRRFCHRVPAGRSPLSPRHARHARPRALPADGRTGAPRARRLAVRDSRVARSSTRASSIDDAPGG